MPFKKMPEEYELLQGDYSLVQRMIINPSSATSDHKLKVLEALKRLRASALDAINEGCSYHKEG